MDSDEFIEPGRLLEQNGFVCTGRIGEANCRLFQASDAIDVACGWMKEKRMRRLTAADSVWLTDYLRKEPEYNLFLLGDLENFGFDVPFQDLMAYRKPETPDLVDSVLLRYHNHFIVYSDHDDFVVDPLLSALKYPDLDILSGKKEVIDRLQPYLQDYHFREMFLMKRPVGECAPSAPKDNAGPSIQKQSGTDPTITDATRADVPELAAFIHSIEEFRNNNTTLEQRIKELTSSISESGTRYVLIRENGIIVACAGTTAENNCSAMVVGVATAPGHRGRGYATRLVSRLCTYHQIAGRDYLCLFYDNPSAGIIYRRLGFVDAGIWVMGTAPARI